MRNNYKLSALKLRVKKASPYILIGTSLVGFGASVYLSMQKGAHLARKIEEVDEYILHIDFETPMQEKKLYYKKASQEVIKTMWLPMTTFAASSACLIFGIKLLNNKLVGTKQLIAATTANTAAILKNVEDQFGEEARKEIERGVIEMETPEDSYARKNPPKNEMCGVWFESSNSFFEDDPEYNVAYIKNALASADTLMAHKGYLTMNEMYELLDIPKTRFGSVYGWYGSVCSDSEEILTKVEVEGIAVKVKSNYISWSMPQDILENIKLLEM